jgi:hypothetical protein
MEFSGYLCLRKSGWKLSGRLSVKRPSLASGEVPLKISVQVPDALFVTPQLRATITIPDSAVTPPTLNAQVLDNVREVLQQQTGMSVTIAVVEPTEVV